MGGLVAQGWFQPPVSTSPSRVPPRSFSALLLDPPPRGAVLVFCWWHLGAPPPLFSSATPPHSLSTHGFSARICSFLFLLATCTYLWEFICCLSFSENITRVGFLPPPALCSLWPGEIRREDNMSSRVLQLKLIRNSGFPTVLAEYTDHPLRGPALGLC